MRYLTEYYDQNEAYLIDRQSMWASQWSLMYEFFKRHNIVPTYTPIWLKSTTAEISIYDAQEQL